MSNTGIGRFDQRVEIKKPVKTRDANTNELVTTYETVKSVWAMVTPVRSRERFLSERQLGILTYKFLIRALSLEDVSQEYVVVWDGQEFDIIGISKIGNRKRDKIEIQAEVRDRDA